MTDERKIINEEWMTNGWWIKKNNDKNDKQPNRWTNDKQWTFRVEWMMKNYEQSMSKWQLAMKSWVNCYEWCNMIMNGW